MRKVKEHTKQINDIQTSVDLTMVITASKDNTAKVCSTVLGFRVTPLGVCRTSDCPCLKPMFMCQS